MNCWTCSRTNSSNRSQVLLTFASGVRGCGVFMTSPPSLPGLQPGGLGHPRGYAACPLFPHNFKLPPLSANRCLRREEQSAGAFLALVLLHLQVAAAKGYTRLRAR